MAEPESGWTIETLLSHLQVLQAANDKRYEQRFDAQQKAVELGFAAQKAAVDAALAAADRAVQKAELAAEKRFESVNEFRNTLADQQRNLMPRSEVQVLVAAAADKVQTLKEQVDRLMSERQGLKGGWTAAVGVVGFVVVVLTLMSIAANFLNKG